jgi:hypothetical protein
MSEEPSAAGHTHPEPNPPIIEAKNWESWPERFNHWPHAEEHARTHFNTEQIESHALRILARGVRSHRLVAFVGAGASMAYGRLTWTALMDKLAAPLFSKSNRPEEVAKPIFELWEDSLEKFRAESDHPLKAEICDELLKKTEKKGGRTNLRKETANLLEDPTGFILDCVERAIKACTPQGNEDPTNPLELFENIKRTFNKVCSEPSSADQPHGLRSAQEAIKKFLEESANDPKKLTELLSASLSRRSILEDSILRNRHALN